ncbi:hypothetical protein JCM8097_006229 [Rhodosporidiobolus ruineniae]
MSTSSGAARSSSSSSAPSSASTRRTRSSSRSGPDNALAWFVSVDWAPYSRTKRDKLYAYWQFSSPLGRDHDFGLYDYAGDELPAVNSISATAMGKYKRDMLRKRQSDTQILIEMLEEDSTADEAALLLSNLKYQLVNHYEGDISFAGLTLKNGSWVVTMAHAQKTVSLDGIDTSALTFTDEEFGKRTASLDVDALSLLQDHLTSAEGMGQRRAFMGLVLALVDGDEASRQNTYVPPTGAQRMMRFERELAKISLGETTYYEVSLGIPWTDSNDKTFVNLRCTATASRLNNPGHAIPFFSLTLSLAAWLEEDGDPALYEVAAYDWLQASQEYVLLANSQKGGVDVEDVKRKLTELRPAARLPAGGHGRSYGLGPQLISHNVLRHALSSACSSTLGSQREHLSPIDPRFPPMLKVLVDNHVQVDPLDDGKHIIIDGFTEEVLWRGPIETELFSTTVAKMQGTEFPVSVDHHWQVTLQMDDHSKLEAVFHSPSNIMATSPRINRTKHRYNTPLLALFMALVYLHHLLFGVFGFLTTQMLVFAAIVRIILLITRIYPLWPISCIHAERRLHSPALIVDSQSFVARLNKKLGISFHVELPGLPTSFRFRLGVATASKEINDEIKKRCDRAGLTYADEGDAYLDEKVNIASGLTTARPLTYESRPVKPADVAAVKSTGLRLGSDAVKKKIFPRRNVDGLPAMSVDGLEDAEDITRSCDAMSKSIKAASRFRTGEVVEIPPHVIYGLIISENVKRADKARKNKDEEVRELVLTSGSLWTVPFVVPSQNKGPLSPSPSRLSHGSTTYDAGCSNHDPSTITLEDYSDDNTFTVDAWLVNAALGAGFEEAMAEEMKGLRKSAKAWFEGRCGAAMRWMASYGSAWTPTDEAAYKAFWRWFEEEFEA